MGAPSSLFMLSHPPVLLPCRLVLLNPLQQSPAADPAGLSPQLPRVSAPELLSPSPQNLFQVISTHPPVGSADSGATLSPATGPRWYQC